MATNNKVLDSDIDMLDMELEGIEDLPGFTVPHNGDYNLTMQMALKKINEKLAVEASFKVVDCIKKDNDADPDTAPGEQFSILYFWQGEPDAVKMSQGRLKQLMSAIAETLGEGNLKILMRDHFASPVNVAATVKRTVSKDDPEKFYARVSNLRLA